MPTTGNLTTTYPLGHSISRIYDAMNHITSETDALANVTRYIFNAKKQPIPATSSSHFKIP